MPVTRHHFRALLAAVLLGAVPAMADNYVLFHGKVTLADGSPPGHTVFIQRSCEGGDQPLGEGSASGRTGEYFVRLQVNELGQLQASLDMCAMLPCYLEAVDKGFVSSHEDLTDRTVMHNPRLPAMILTPKSQTTQDFSRNTNVPHAASRNWDAASSC